MQVIAQHKGKCAGKFLSISFHKNLFIDFELFHMHRLIDFHTLSMGISMLQKTVKNAKQITHTSTYNI